jgi:hypothetical protein
MFKYIKGRTLGYTAFGLQKVVDGAEALKADKARAMKGAQDTAYLSILSNLMLWLSFLMDLPDWAKITFGVLVVLSIAACLANIYFSKDRHEALDDILNVIKWIIEFIVANQPPEDEVEASFVAGPLTGSAPLTVTFEDRSIGAPTYWTWDFGDGAKSTMNNTTHMYSNKGTYNVSLTVRKGEATNTKVQHGYITVTDGPANQPPGIEFEPMGDVTLVKVGGEHQVNMPEALKGGNGWKGLTVKVMDGLEADFDVLPNFIWAFWYDGKFSAPGWMISSQGYYYLDNPITDKNCIHSIVDKPWIQP